MEVEKYFCVNFYYTLLDLALFGGSLTLFAVLLANIKLILLNKRSADADFFIAIFCKLHYLLFYSEDKMSKRIDLFLVENKIFESRSKASEAISLGAVLVNGKIQLKPSYLVKDDDNIEIAKQTDKYVSRAGYKLEKAIQEFNIDLSNKTILDIGSSTGGFTDCALQSGAKKVFAVDVGKDQLHQRLREDPRVVSMEQTNILQVSQDIFNQVDFIVCDVSFVSGASIFQQLNSKIQPGTKIIWLVKPQFECGKQVARKYKGIITNTKLSEDIARSAIHALILLNFKQLAFTTSPIKGGDGNTEYIAYIEK